MHTMPPSKHSTRRAGEGRKEEWSGEEEVYERSLLLSASHSSLKPPLRDDFSVLTPFDVTVRGQANEEGKKKTAKGCEGVLPGT